MLLGHWGTTPRQNFIYVHLNQMNIAYPITGAILVAIGIASGRVVQRGNVASSDEQILGRRS